MMASIQPLKLRVNPCHRAMGWIAVVLLMSISLGNAQFAKKSLLNSDPDVVYLQDLLEKPMELEVVKDAPVYSSKDGKTRLGTLRAGQKVKVEAITDKAYRVRGDGLKHGIAGWVGPWAFKMPSPDFEQQMKDFYARQMLVKQLIEEGKLVIGMSMKEVAMVMGEPTKTSIRKTKDGETGSWEFTEYDEVRNYATRVDPYTGQMTRYLVSITTEEKEKTVVEFKDGCVVALEASQSRQGDVQIILPRVTWVW